MIGESHLPEIRIPPSRSIANAIRRRVWRWLFAPSLRGLGPFFCDPRDHIGAERIIMGAPYEGVILSVLDVVITRLKLGRGAALDVGANIGNHACWFAERFNRVICVEPGVVASIVLDANLKARRVGNASIHRCALGRAEGSGVLEVVDLENLGSSVAHRVDVNGEFPIRQGDQFWEEVAPEAMQLDLVKIDVEGAEVEVVQGLARVLGEKRPLVCVEVLDPERWRLVRESLMRAGYTSWFVIHGQPNPSRFLSRSRAALLGRTHQLEQMPDVFREGGYDMVICMTDGQRTKIEPYMRLGR